MRKVVKDFFVSVAIFMIFFLTGCAGPRYHGSTSPGSSAPASRTIIASPVTLGWPILGRIVSIYGAKEDGVTLKGLVLEGSEGQEVRSAEHGQVVFVDPGLRGYGKTIIVEHSSGYSTVYARSSQILVQTGDWVNKGQAIARIGHDGKGMLPRVYFEVRQNSKPLDPQRVLKSSSF